MSVAARCRCLVVWDWLLDSTNKGHMAIACLLATKPPPATQWAARVHLLSRPRQAPEFAITLVYPILAGVSGGSWGEPTAYNAPLRHLPGAR